MIGQFRRLPLTPVVLLILSFINLLWGLQNRQEMGPVPAYFVDAASIPIRLADKIQDSLSSTWKRYVYLIHLSGDYERLLGDNERLLQKVNVLEEYAHENERLRKLLNFKEKTKLPLLPARVISFSDPSEPVKAVIIDKGSLDGIEENMAVVTAKGVVGRTWSVGLTSSRVLLLADTRSGVSSLLQRTREKGIVWGTGSEKTLRMQRVRNITVIEPGEIVTSSGLGGVYPKGLMVGRVKGISELSDQLFEYLDLEPEVDFSRLEEVLVVLKPEENGAETTVQP